MSASVCYHCNHPISNSAYPGDREVNCSICLTPFHAACRNIDTPVIHEYLNAKIVHIICQPCITQQSEIRNNHSNGRITNNCTLPTAVTTSTQSLATSHDDLSNINLISDKNAPATSTSIEAKLKVERSLNTLGSHSSESTKPKLRLKLCLDYDYGYGFCPYGSTCRFKHVKVCWNFIRTGGCFEMCKDRLFHQVVCSSSKENRTCFDKECKRYHISGTKRRKPLNLAVRPSVSTPQPRLEAPQKEESVTPSEVMGIGLGPSQQSINNYGIAPAPPNTHVEVINPETLPYSPLQPRLPIQVSNTVSSLQTNVRHHQQRLQASETMLHQLTESFSHLNSRMENFLNANNVGFNNLGNSLNQAMQILDYTQSNMTSLANSLTLNEERLRKSEETQNMMTTQLQQLTFLLHNPRYLPSHTPITTTTPQPITLNTQPLSNPQNFSPQSDSLQLPQAVVRHQAPVIPNSQNFTKDCPTLVPR